MLPNVSEYYKPATMQEALRLLRRRGVPTVPLAGGTHLLTRRDPGVQALVDLSGLGLNYIRQGADNLEIGAMTTLQSLATSPVLTDVAGGLLATAAHCTATRTIRNMATIGGSVVSSGPATDIVVALLVLDASIRTATGKRFRLHDYLQNGRLQRQRHVFVEVQVPLTTVTWRSAFCRVARLPSDEAIVNVAVALRYENGLCQDVHLAAGGVGAVPVRLPVAEGLLLGTPLTQADIERAISLQQNTVEPLSDIHGSAEYRRAMLAVLLRRAVQQCVDGRQG